MTKTIKILKWGIEQKCGKVGCNKQTSWGEFFHDHACETHRNYQRGLCNICQTNQTTHTINDVNYSSEIEEKERVIKAGVELQKDIIAKLLTYSLSAELRQKLNSAQQKCLEVEKIIPQLESYHREYTQKILTYKEELLREKGGQQVNIHEYNLCDHCHQELDKRKQALEKDYQSKVNNKLNILNQEIFDQVKKEVKDKEIGLLVIEVAFKLDEPRKKNEKDQQQLEKLHKETMAKYHFLDRFPIWKKNSAVNKQKKIAFYHKLKQYYDKHGINQINENDGYTIYYANGNIKKVSDSQLDIYSQLRTWFFNTSSRDGLSRYELNRLLSEADISEQELESYLKNDVDNNDNNTHQGNLTGQGGEKNINPVDRAWLKHYFQEKQIKEIKLDKGQLIITHNNNSFSTEEAIKDQELQKIQRFIQNQPNNSLTLTELQDKVDNSHDASSNAHQPKNFLTGLAIGGAVVLLTGVVIFSLTRKNKKK